MGHWAFWFLIFQGKIYYVSVRDFDDKPALAWLSQRLAGIRKGDPPTNVRVTGKLIESENTFEAVQRSRISWQPYDDLVNPYGDRRGISVDSVWTLDLDNDMLVLDQHTANRKISLATILQRAITLEDLEPYEPPTLPQVNLEDGFPPPYWDPPDRELQGVEAFVARILTNFAFQWRHILRNRYNDSTFRKLASAVLRIATLDFRVVEEGPRRRWRNTHMVGVYALPEWQAFDKPPIFQMNGVRVVLCQDIENSISLLRKDYTSCENKTDDSQQDQRELDQHATYLILSLRHVVLCSLDDKTVRYTQPEPLFDGTNPPSEGAIKLLLHALYSAYLDSPLHYLPPELQDMAIKNVSEGEVERARIACVLGLWTPFSWKSGDRPLERVVYWRNRFRGPIEQQIWFAKSFSGLAYC